MEACLSQVGIHILPAPAALQQLGSKDASYKTMSKWFAALCTSHHHLTEHWLLQA